jgi:hypothetical protein
MIDFLSFLSAAATEPVIGQPHELDDGLHRRPVNAPLRVITGASWRVSSGLVGA